MKYVLQIVLISLTLISLTLISCTAKSKTYKNYESEILKIERISQNVYRHISYLETKSNEKIACNGMIFINGNEAVIFDTPTDNNAANELINWIGETNIKAVVVTHFHIDCLGGLESFHSNGIESYATNKTIQLAKENNKKILPQNHFDDEYQFQVGDEVVYAKYFGQGHTQDNIVGYIPSEKTLFGSCLIKHLNATKGNLADANTEDWPSTVTKIKREFPDLETVIPGHGETGGIELLDYTIELFNLHNQRFVFFLHNRFLETHELTEPHPEFGQTEYLEIISEFEKSGFTVLSEKRNGNVNARDYAKKIVNQVDSLIKIEAEPQKITVVGTSKGGYIAQYVSTFSNNQNLNFVFIASFVNSDIQDLPDINYCGNILTIYENSDPFGVSALERMNNSNCKIEHFKEIELNTQMGHEFLFKPLKEWMEPTIKWAKGDYLMENYK